MEKSDLKVGLKFQKFYNDNNFNNIQYCEVRGIVDECQIVLYCKKDATKMSDYKEFYQTIDIIDFEFNVENKVYISLRNNFAKMKTLKELNF